MECALVQILVFLDVFGDAVEWKIDEATNDGPALLERLRATLRDSVALLEPIRNALSVVVPQSHRVRNSRASLLIHSWFQLSLLECRCMEQLRELYPNLVDSGNDAALLSDAALLLAMRQLPVPLGAELEHYLQVLVYRKCMGLRNETVLDVLALPAGGALVPKVAAVVGNTVRSCLPDLFELLVALQHHLGDGTLMKQWQRSDKPVPIMRATRWTANARIRGDLEQLCTLVGQLRTPPPELPPDLAQQLQERMAEPAPPTAQHSGMRRVAVLIDARANRQAPLVVQEALEVGDAARTELVEVGLAAHVTVIVSNDTSLFTQHEALSAAVSQYLQQTQLEPNSCCTLLAVDRSHPDVDTHGEEWRRVVVCLRCSRFFNRKCCLLAVRLSARSFSAAPMRSSFVCRPAAAIQS